MNNCGMRMGRIAHLYNLLNINNIQSRDCMTELSGYMVFMKVVSVVPYFMATQSCDFYYS